MYSQYRNLDSRSEPGARGYSIFSNQIFIESLNNCFIPNYTHMLSLLAHEIFIEAFYDRFISNDTRVDTRASTLLVHEIFVKAFYDGFVSYNSNADGSFYVKLDVCR